MVSATRLCPAALVVAASLTIGACTFPEVPIDPGPARMVVHAVLDAGRDTQIVRVSYSDGSYPNGDVPAVTATVTTPDGIVMTARPGGWIPLSAYGVTLVPGGTYSLRVTSSAGHVVTGTTTIPKTAAVSMNPPVETFRRASDTLRMTAPAVDGVGSVEFSIAEEFSDGRSTYSFTIYHTFTNGQVAFAGTARAPLQDQDLFEPGQRRVAVLTAVDVNYYEYYRVLSDPFAGATPSRLSGGLGVFGAVVPVRVRRLDVR